MRRLISLNSLLLVSFCVTAGTLAGKTPTAGDHWQQRDT
jgi:hypothetical protein